MINRRGYLSFCSKYDIDPNNVDEALWVIDELIGQNGDADGKLEEIREYVMDKLYTSSTAETNSDSDGGDYGVAVSVFQVKEGKTRYYAFMPFEFVKEKYGGVDLENYELVATVYVPKDIANGGINKVLDYVFTFGNTGSKFYADNPRARSISVSDLLYVGGVYYYVDNFGFSSLNDKEDLIEIQDNLEEDKKSFTEDGKAESTEDKEEVEIEDDIDEEEADKTLLDYLQDRIGQQMNVGELNTVLQSLFARYNKVFLLKSDLYNMDLDESQELIVDDDEDMYVITYDIVDVDDAIIEITDVNIEN